MGTVKQINIKNQTYYFYNIIDLKIFDSSLLKLDKKSYKDIGIYNIGYITINSIDENKELLKKYNVFNGIIDKIKKICVIMKKAI